MIAELGRLKDDGLHILAMKEALQSSARFNEEIAFKKTYQLLGPKQKLLPSFLLDEAENTCKVYFNEHNLESLVIGPSKIVRR